MSDRRDSDPRLRALDDDTIDPAGTAPSSEAGLVPTLTVLAHPDVRRVGERARLDVVRAGGRLALSRLEPAFRPPDSAAARPAPLLDPAVSRRALWICGGSDGDVLIDARSAGSRVVVDDDPVDETLTVPAAAIAGGVVLELARRVALLLHFTDPSVERLRDADRSTLIGENGAVERIRSEIRSVGGTDVPVLLRGETGTGKELLARAIHRASRRAAAPFVSVNMAAIPATTAASALFGHTRGSFTGALRDQAGFFQRAHGGTLFLDEVGDTPPDVQGMLLRVLETGEVQRVGAQRHEVVDVRLVAATDTDLHAAVMAGRFRAPLLHRLSAYEIVAPPLRARRDDIARLLVHFVRAELRALDAEDRLAPPEPGGRPWLPAALVGALVRHDWPGNVRQLHNFARQLVIASRGAVQVDTEAMLRRLRGDPTPSLYPVDPHPPPTPTPPEGEDTEPRRLPSEIEDDELVAALRRNRWRLEPAARDLGISKTSIYGLVDASDRVRKARNIGRSELLRCREACRGDLDAMSEQLEVSARALKIRLGELGITI